MLFLRMHFFKKILVEKTENAGQSLSKRKAISSHFFMRRTKAKTDSISDIALKRSDVYKEFLAEREEIMKHKWLESEKAGHDIGYDKALLDWIMNHREKWRTSYRRRLSSSNRHASH